MRPLRNINTLLAACMLIFLLSTCRREYSTEGGIYTTACLNDYTASCKLLKIEYTANGVLGADNTADFTYTGNQLTKATDNISTRTFTWQAGLIVKINTGMPAPISASTPKR